MNAEFQRIARRDKKAFLSDQFKEIEEDNRMGKTRDVFKKMRDTKGTFHASLVQFSAQLCLNLCDPMNRSMSGLPVHCQLPESTQTHVHESVMPSNHLILCHPLLLLSSIFPRIRVFSNEYALHIRWPKYWSFSFSISHSNEHPGLISFRMD